MQNTPKKEKPLVELINLKYSDFASHETPCYEASVRIDGADAGMVRNDGQGGASCYLPPGLRDRVDAIARLQPPLDLGGELVDMDGDTFLAALVFRTLDAQDAMHDAPHSQKVL